MGSYIYKVTAKIKVLEDGSKANIAVYAYKPTHSFFNGDKLNRRWAWQAKCHLAEKYVETSRNYTGRVVLGEGGTEAINCDRGTFTDDWFCTQAAKAR